MAMRTSFRLGACFAALICAAANAQTVPGSQPGGGRVSNGVGFIEGMVGIDLPSSGTIVKSGLQGGSLTVGGASLSASANVRSVDFRTAYDTPLVLGFSIGRVLSDGSEVFGGFRFMRASAKDFALGTAAVSGTINAVPFAAGTPLTGKLNDHQEFGIEAGYRRFFNPMWGGQPYAAGILGLSRVNERKLNVSVPGGTVSDIRFSKSGYIPNGTFLIGYRAGDGARYSVSLEGGVRYDFAPKADDADLAASGLDSINNSDGRVSFPARILGRIAF
jgi:hypothetical protein